MSIHFSLQSPLSAPLTSAYFASLHVSRDYTAPACSCRLTFLKHPPPSPLPPQNLSFSAAVLWIFQVMLVGAGTCMRNTDERCLAINGRIWKFDRDYLKRHHTVFRTGPWLLIKDNFILSDYNTCHLICSRISRYYVKWLFISSFKWRTRSVENDICRSFYE